MSKNYFYIDGNKIPMSQDTADSILKSQKQLTYRDIARKLFQEGIKDHFDLDSTNYNQKTTISSIVQNSHWTCNKISGYNLLSTTKEQLESILALNKLCNVAKYLNGNWKLDVETQNNRNTLVIDIFKAVSTRSNDVGWGLIEGKIYFKTQELAEQAIEILGEDEIKKALTLNH